MRWAAHHASEIASWCKIRASLAAQNDGKAAKNLEEVGVVTAKIDVSKVAEARGKVPSLFNDRSYRAPEPLHKAEAAE